MSEKRFEAEYTIPFAIIDTVENKSYSSMRNVLELLNALAEENSALMKTLLYFIKDDDGEWINQVLEENEQLKYQLNSILNDYEDYDEDLGICCICENLEGIYIEQYHEAEYHCKIDGFQVERQKRLCEKFQIK